MSQKILAFVAKSFNPIDEAKIEPIVKILKAFNKAGFLLQDAEQAEVESVSQKVRMLIDESNVLVGFFTKRHPIYQLGNPWSALLSLLTGRLKPTASSAPPWVLQESGYALKGNKALILFREEGVEIPGLQGDLEYIPLRERQDSFFWLGTRLPSRINLLNGIRTISSVQSLDRDIRVQQFRRSSH